MVLAVISQKFLPCGCESLGRHAFPKFLEIEKAKKKNSLWGWVRFLFKVWNV